MISNNIYSPTKQKPDSISTNIERKNSYSSPTPTSSQSPGTSGYYNSNAVNTTNLDLTDLKEKDADVKGWINKMLSSPATFPMAKPSQTDRNNSVSDISPILFNSSPSTTNIITSSNTTPTDNNNIPQQASILLIKLENAGQQISNSIEKISNEVVKNIPRVLYDIENIRKDTRTMQENINRVRMDYRKFNTDSSEVIQPMFLLDTIRLRMEETRKLLKEAENWSNLSSEMDEIFNNKEYERAATTLEDAQNSLAILKNSADYEEKRELLRKYLNRLEAELSPLLLQTIKSKNIQNLRKYQRIFKKIDREREFYNCYFRNVKQEILEYWMGFEVKDSEQQEVVVPVTPVTPKIDMDEKEMEENIENANNILIINSTNPQNLNFAEWVPSYFEELYSIIVKEFNWSANIFRQPGDVVCHLINESNKYLKPSFSERLESFKEDDKSHFIVSLINIYKTVENFAKTIEHHILFQRETSRFLKMSTFSKSPANIVMSRFNKNYNFGNWGESLFEPFLPYQQDFAHLEYIYLVDQLKQLFKPDVMAHKSPNELVDHLHLAINKIFDHLTGTLNRCIDFTYGYACPGTLKIINDYLVAALEKYSDILRVIRTRTEIKPISKIREEHKLGINSPLSSNGSISNFSKSSINESAMVDTDEDLFQERNRQIWTNFQLGFKLLGICNLFDKEIKQMEQEKLAQFFKIIFLNRKTLEETHVLLTQLDTLLKLNHADSEYDLESTSPMTTPKRTHRRKSKLFNSSGDNIEVDDDEDSSDSDVVDKIASNDQGPDKEDEGQDEDKKSKDSKDSKLKAEPTEEDLEKIKRYKQKSEKELKIFQELYQAPYVGSVLSREIIRLSSLNSYELRECCRIIAKQYYVSTPPPSTDLTEESNNNTNTNTNTNINTNTNTDETTDEKAPTSTTVMDIMNDAELRPLPLDQIQSTMLNNVKGRMSRITHECQRFIYDSLFLTIDEQLSDIYHKDHWSHITTNKVSPFNFEIPQFSLSPSTYIVNIGEHLLSLPQHLELYLNDEALTYSVNTLPYCQPMELLTHSLLEDLNITPSTQLSKKKSNIQDEDSEFEEPSGHMWIVSLCNGTMIKFIKDVMKLKEITSQESKQLGTDINYLINIFGALEIYILPILSHLNTFCQMQDKELIQRKEELEALLDKRLNLDETNSTEENQKEESELSSSMLYTLTEHEEYELIKL